MDTLSFSLRRFRVCAGLSQEQVGELVGGKRKATVSAWETGKAQPSIEDLLTLAGYYGVTLDGLVGGLLNKHTVVSGARPVPLLTLEQAGSAEIDAHMQHSLENGLTVPAPAALDSGAYALRVEGSSMVSTSGPSYPPGVYIFCEPSQVAVITSGDRVIARTLEGRAVFRELVDEDGERWLRPLNPTFGRIDHGFKIIARVVGTYVPEL